MKGRKRAVGPNNNDVHMDMVNKNHAAHLDFNPTYKTQDENLAPVGSVMRNQIYGESVESDQNTAA